MYFLCIVVRSLCHKVVSHIDHVPDLRRSTVHTSSCTVHQPRITLYPSSMIFYSSHLITTSPSNEPTTIDYLFQNQRLDLLYCSKRSKLCPLPGVDAMEYYLSQTNDITGTIHLSFLSSSFRTSFRYRQ